MDVQELIRDTWQTALVFVSLLIFTRILGKTQVGQLTFYEYVTGITIGSIAACFRSIDLTEPGLHLLSMPQQNCLLVLPKAGAI